MDQAQFSAPSDLLDGLAGSVRSIALRHGMQDCLPRAVVVGAVACFRTGDTSFTFVGVRRAGELAIVDLAFRSAGIGGRLFDELESEITLELKAAFGEGVVERRERKRFIPFEYARH